MIWILEWLYKVFERIYVPILRRELREVLLNRWANPRITRTITSRRCRECTIKSASFSLSTTTLSRCWSFLKSSTCHNHVFTPVSKGHYNQEILRYILCTVRWCKKSLKFAKLSGLINLTIYNIHFNDFLLVHCRAISYIIYA